MTRARTVAAVSMSMIGAVALTACESKTKDALDGAASVVVTTAAAQEGCSLIGSWTTQKPGVGIGDGIMATVAGSNSSGTFVTDVPRWPEVTAYVAHVTMRGAWKRTGGNTFAFTQFGWIPGPDGAPHALVKNVGTQTVSDDCNMTTAEGTMTAYDVASGTLLVGPVTLLPTELYRVVVETQ